MSERGTYDQLWKAGWSTADRELGPSHRTRRRILLSLFDRAYASGADVLDVGCGDGGLLSAIRDLHPDVGSLSGSDISDAALNIARTRVDGACFFRWDIQADAMPLEKSFDIITCSEVLEHIDDVDSALLHLQECLRPSGHLLVSVPHSMKHWGIHDEAVHHVRRFEERKLGEDLERNGFEVLRTLTWGTGLYRAYYSLVLNKMKPKSTWKKPSWLSRQAQRILYRLFFLDDLLKGIGCGRMLFALARRKD